MDVRGRSRVRASGLRHTGFGPFVEAQVEDGRHIALDPTGTPR